MKLMLRSGMVVLSVLAIVGFMLPSGALAVKEIKIGVIYPLSGGAAAAGRELRAGAELAMEVVNNKMPGLVQNIANNAGIKSLDGAKIKLIFKDHAGNPTLGANLAKKLIKDDKVVGIMGCYHSSVTKTVSQVCENNGVPMINSSSSSPTLTTRGFKWFWRTMPHDWWFTKDLFMFLKGISEGKARGVKAVPFDDINVVASCCEKTEFGSATSDLINELAKKYGFKVKKSILYAAKSPDLSGEVRSLKATRADAFLFASYTSDAILMVKTMKAQKTKAKIIWGQNAGFEQPTFVKNLGDNVDGICTRSVFVPKIAEAKKAAGQVDALYKKKMGHAFNGAAARGYVCVQTWAETLEKAGSTKPVDIQKACNSLYIPGDQLALPWKGIKFAQTGKEVGQNELGGGVIAQYQKNKKGDIVAQIVFPFDMATSDLIYPFKSW